MAPMAMATLLVSEGGRRREAPRGGACAAGVHLRGDAVVGTQEGLLAGLVRSDVPDDSGS